MIPMIEYDARVYTTSGVAHNVTSSRYSIGQVESRKLSEHKLILLSYLNMYHINRILGVTKYLLGVRDKTFTYILNLQVFVFEFTFSKIPN
jgi:hypothetical protein